MKRLSALAGLIVILAAATAMGQTTVLEPIVREYAEPVTVWRPVTSDVPAMTVTPAGTTTVTYSAPYTTSYSYSAPTVTRYAPVEVVPWTTYSAPVRSYYAPVTTYYTPVTTYYSPVVTSYAPSYVVGRGSIGQPVLYVPGQPVRNALRFFSP
jgi:hypothetical protein